MSKSKLFLLGIAGGLVGAALVATPILITNSIQAKSQNQLNEAKQKLEVKIAEANALKNDVENKDDLNGPISVLEATIRQGNILLGNIYPSVQSINQATKNINDAMVKLQAAKEQLETILSKIKDLQEEINKVEAIIDSLGSSPIEQSYKEELQQAVDKAKEVLPEREDQTNITNAISSLKASQEAATAKFGKAQAAYKGLVDAIAAAKAVEIADDAYLAEVKTALNNAIATAEGALNSKTVDELTTATTNLNNAKDQAVANKEALTTAHGQLVEAIAAAKAVEISDDAYLAEVKTTLSDAITTAEGSLNSTVASDITNATTTLNNTKDKAIADKEALTTAHGQLEAAIAEAKAVVIPEDKTFLSGVKATLDAAIAKAEAALVVTSSVTMDDETRQLQEALLQAKTDMQNLSNANDELSKVLEEAKAFKQENQDIVRNNPAVALLTDELMDNANTALSSTDIETMNTAKLALSTALENAKAKLAEIQAAYDQALTGYNEALEDAKTLSANPKYAAQKSNLDQAITQAEQNVAAVEANAQTADLYNTEKDNLLNAMNDAKAANANALYTEALTNAKALIEGTMPKYTEADNKASYDVVKEAVDAAEQAVANATDPKTDTYLEQESALNKAISKAAYEAAKATTTAKANLDSTIEQEKEVLNAGLQAAAEQAQADTVEGYTTAVDTLTLADANGLYVSALANAEDEKFNLLLSKLNENDATLASVYQPAVAEIKEAVTNTVDSYTTSTAKLNDLVTIYTAKAKTVAIGLYDAALAAAKQAQTDATFDTQTTVKQAFDEAVTNATLADKDNATAYELFDKSEALTDALNTAKLNFAKANYDAQVAKVNTAIAENGALVSVKEQLDQALAAATNEVAQNTPEAYDKATSDLVLAYAKAGYDAELLNAALPARNNVYTSTNVADTYNTSLDQIKAKVNENTTATEFETYAQEVKALISTTDSNAMTQAKSMFDAAKTKADDTMNAYQTSNSDIYNTYTAEVAKLTAPADGTDLAKAEVYLGYIAQLAKQLSSSIYQVNLAAAKAELANLGDDQEANGVVEAYNAKSTLEEAIRNAEALVSDDQTESFTTASENLKQAVEAAKLAKAKHDYQLVLANATGDLSELYAEYDTEQNNQTYNQAIETAKATLTNPTVQLYADAAKSILNAQSTINASTLAVMETNINNQQSSIQKAEAAKTKIESDIQNTSGGTQQANKQALERQKEVLVELNSQLTRYTELKTQLENAKTNLDAELAKYPSATSTSTSTPAAVTPTPAATAPATTPAPAPAAEASTSAA